MLDEGSQRFSTGGPLAGLRVIDMTTSYAGPTASMYLADLGADVIKVERPGGGDDCRGWGPPFVGGVSAWFTSTNRNKRSVVVNLRADAGVHLLHTLIGNADVFMQNLNPSKLERLRVDPDTLMEWYPRLIYCAISGFGLDGRDSALPGYDLTAQARSGLMSVTGPKGGTPERVSTALSDIVAGMSAALAISAATVRQRDTGLGEVIDVSLLEADLALMAPRIAAYLAGEEEPAPSGGTDSVLAVYQPFHTADRPLVVAVGNDAMWLRFCHALELDALADDPELATNADRRARRDWITLQVEQQLVRRTAAEWLEIFAAADVPCSVVQSLSEVVADPHIKARNSLMPVPGFEDLYSVRSPFRFASMGRPRNEGPPVLGAHTREVLEELGLSSEEISVLVSEQAVEIERVGATQANPHA